MVGPDSCGFGTVSFPEQKLIKPERRATLTKPKIQLGWNCAEPADNGVPKQYTVVRLEYRSSTAFGHNRAVDIW